MINTVAQLKLDEPRSVRAAILGKGNKTLRDEVAKEIKKVPVVIREVKETPDVVHEIKEKTDVIAEIKETRVVEKERPIITEKSDVLKGLRRGPKKD